MADKINLEQKLNENLAPKFMEINDLSDGCGSKFEIIVVSDKFHNKTLLQRHRLVNSIIAEELKQIHAFSQKTYTPEEWSKQVSQEK